MEFKQTYNINDAYFACNVDKTKVLYFYAEAMPMSNDDRQAYRELIARLLPQDGGYLPAVAIRIWAAYQSTPYAGAALSVHLKTDDGHVDEDFLPLDVDFSTINWQNVA